MEVEQQTTAQTAIDPDDIVRRLKPDEWRLPEQAIREAQQHREAVTPRLIASIQRATEQVRSGEEPDVDVTLFALYLLTEFQAKEALPAILEAVSLPDDGPDDLFGDAITELLPRTLAILADDQPELLEGLMASETINKYVRWNAARALVYLVRDGRMTRAAAVEALRRQLRAELDRDEWEFTTMLLWTLSQLNPHEAVAEIDEAFERNMVETFWIRREDIRTDPALPDEKLDLGEFEGVTAVVDTFDELRWWASFREPRKAEERPARLPPPARVAWGDDNAIEPVEPLDRPIVRETPRVGRNEPCPCGSGRKFKKCCLREV